MLHHSSTIVALATAPLAAGVAVIRLSGAHSLQGLALLGVKKALKPRHAYYQTLLDSQGVPLDQALVLYFENPHSFTGEDVVEIHCHGGLSVIEGIMNTLCSHENIRPAEAGEFSRRAFLNGKMTLLQAEGIADLVASETEEQRRQALEQTRGETGEAFTTWREELMHALAHVEAAIDFPDEEIDVLEDAGVEKRLTHLENTLKTALNNHMGERIRDGFRLAIVGKPNAGKSTLLNLLSGEDTAIVSPIAGTTRDVIEKTLNIGGYPVIVADTAGIRETDDVIEKMGVERAQEKMTQADLVLVVISAEDHDTSILEAVPEHKKASTVVIISKKDLAQQTPNMEEGSFIYENLTDKTVLTTILNALKEKIEAQYGRVREHQMITRDRHRKSVELAHAHVLRALSLLNEKDGARYSLSDLLAQDIRQAAQAIGDITGKTSSEDVLDLVFSTFCIGK